MRNGILFFFLALTIVVACSEDEPRGGGGQPVVNPKNDGGDPPTNEPDGAVTPEDGSKPVVSKVNVTSETIDVNGDSRKYDLAVPKTYDAGKTYPLVLVIHGDGGDGPGMRGYHKFDNTSGDEAIVAYPTGHNATWETYGPSENNPDHQFMLKLIEALKGKYSVSKVFGVGWSKGGFFLTHNVCRQPNMFDGLVIHAGGVPYDESTLNGTWPNSGGFQKCDGQTSRTQAAIPALVTHGTVDGSVPWEGGNYLRRWFAYLNQCDEGMTDTAPSPCKSHNNCKTGKAVHWCSIEGNNHGIWDQGASAGWAFLKTLL